MAAVGPALDRRPGRTLGCRMGSSRFHLPPPGEPRVRLARSLRRDWHGGRDDRDRQSQMGELDRLRRCEAGRAARGPPGILPGTDGRAAGPSPPPSPRRSATIRSSESRDRKEVRLASPARRSSSGARTLVPRHRDLGACPSADTLAGEPADEGQTIADDLGEHFVESDRFRGGEHVAGSRRARGWLFITAAAASPCALSLQTAIEYASSRPVRP